jgi:hypothetical protein
MRSLRVLAKPPPQWLKTPPVTTSSVLAVRVLSIVPKPSPAYPTHKNTNREMGEGNETSRFLCQRIERLVKLSFHMNIVEDECSPLTLWIYRNDTEYMYEIDDLPTPEFTCGTWLVASRTRSTNSHPIRLISVSWLNYNRHDTVYH